MSWEQLRSILIESAELNDDLADDLPEECPYDGTPLEWATLEDGSSWLHCPMGNYAVEV